ncbi:MAG: cobalamin B12-binding domain-containing protein [Alphaproteobacteria bacterium]|nr:cobalamin B12-binding domain-containing protein [Alphaproteobacteria bacterium]
MPTAGAEGTGAGQRLRVLVAKPGLDGHDRGAKVIARGLRDAGMEVVYSGLHRTPEQIVRTALEEDVQVVGLSILSGAHMRLLPEVVEGLRREGLDDVLVIAGGIIPEDDVVRLREAGVSAVFPPGTPVSTIVDFVRANAPNPLADGV